MFRTFVGKIGVLICVAVLMIISTNTAFATNPHFEDNFNNGLINWTTVDNTCKYNGKPAKWEWNNGKVGIKFNNSAFCKTHLLPNSLHIPATTPYKYEVDMTMTSTNMDRNILFKYKDANNWYGLHTIGNKVYFEKVINGKQYFPQNWIISFPQEPNHTYHFEIDVYPKESVIYIDGNKIATIQETGPTFKNVTAGLRASTGSIPSNEVYFDNFKISLLENQNPNLPVPNTKQYNPLWKNDEYDHAYEWSHNPTIERWGCALSTASMILQYYGFDTKPNELNKWLKSQPDGYLTNGLVNWHAVSRYSHLNSNENRPILEFTYHSADDSIIESNIKSKIPTIVKIPGHFVTVIGIKANDFTIVDPASEVSLLSKLESSLNQEYTSIYSFTPSQTDLSYILLSIENGFDIKVIGPDKLEIKGYQHKESSITDPLTGDHNNKTLKVFQYPKPSTGKYTIQITGNGFYTMSSYIYNKQGDVLLNHINDYTSKVNEYTLYIGQPNEPPLLSPSFASIIRDFQSSLNNGLVNKRSIQKTILYLLKYSNRLSKYGGRYFYYSKKILSKANYYINKYTPRHIDEQFSRIIQRRISSLKESL